MTTWGIKSTLGIGKGRGDSLAGSLFASPMGRKLYRSLAVRDRGVVNIQVDGKLESVGPSIMACVPTCDVA